MEKLPQESLEPQIAKLQAEVNQLAITNEKLLNQLQANATQRQRHLDLYEKKERLRKEIEQMERGQLPGSGDGEGPGYDVDDPNP